MSIYLYFLRKRSGLSGRVLDSRPKGRGFEPHRRHCVVVLEQDTFILALVLVQPRWTRPCLTEGLLMGRKESNQTNKQNIYIFHYIFVIFLHFLLFVYCVCSLESHQHGGSVKYYQYMICAPPLPPHTPTKKKKETGQTS